MAVSDRIAGRMQARELSQAELARRVGVSQQAIGKLVNGSSRSSTHLHKIARELGTTPAYLSGETDDPDENAPPPAPRPMVQHVLMPVALPSEPALAQMFEGLLESIGRDLSSGELARELAQLLPTALSQLRGRLIERPTTGSVSATAAEVQSTAAGVQSQ